MYFFHACAPQKILLAKDKEASQMLGLLDNHFGLDVPRAP
jgi:hypothetical protein